MKTKTLQWIITAGLLICPALAQEATVNSFLTVDMKCYYQQSGTATGTVGAGKVGVFRISSKQLLQIAAKQLGVKFPSGAKLLVTPDGSVYAVKQNGSVIRSLSDFYTLKRDTENLLFDGRSKQPAGKQTSKNYYPSTLNINVAGLVGTIGGVQIETFNISAPDKFGIRRISSDSKTEISGAGTYNNSLSYYVGDMKLTGKTALIQK